MYSTRMFSKQCLITRFTVKQYLVLFVFKKQRENRRKQVLRFNCLIPDNSFKIAIGF